MMKQRDTPEENKTESNAEAMNKMMKFFGSKKICSKSIKLPEKVRTEEMHEGTIASVLIIREFFIHMVDESWGCFNPESDSLVFLPSVFIVVSS